MKLTTVVMFSLLAIAAIVNADDYRVSVSRKGRNLYKVTGKDVYIRTRYCYEYVYSEDALLRMDGYSGEILFLDSDQKCDVRAVYGPVDQAPGKYVVTVNQEDDDWYEVWGYDIYIKTSGCLSLALGQEAILTLVAKGYGTLQVDRMQCVVEGLYARLKL